MFGHSFMWNLRCFIVSLVWVFRHADAYLAFNVGCVGIALQYKMISNQIDTHKKKVSFTSSMHAYFLHFTVSYPFLQGQKDGLKRSLYLAIRVYRVCEIGYRQPKDWDTFVLKFILRSTRWKKNERFSITPFIPNCLPFLENFAFCTQKIYIYEISFLKKFKRIGVQKFGKKINAHTLFIVCKNAWFPTKDEQFGTNEVFFIDRY